MLIGTVYTTWLKGISYTTGHITTTDLKQKITYISCKNDSISKVWFGEWTSSTVIGQFKSPV